MTSFGFSHSGIGLSRGGSYGQTGVVVSSVVMDGEVEWYVVVVVLSGVVVVLVTIGVVEPVMISVVVVGIVVVNVVVVVVVVTKIINRTRQFRGSTRFRQNRNWV